MRKKFILLAAPPASGKNYVSERLCERLTNVSYFDKDNLSPLTSRLFDITVHERDMDGDFYRENIRDAEYDCLFKIGFDSIKYSSIVLINAPLGKEIRDINFMSSLKNKLNKDSIELIIIWIFASADYCKKNMISRNAARDCLKLKDWDNYVKNINYYPPYELIKENAINQLLIIETKTEKEFNESIENIIQTLNKE